MRCTFSTVAENMTSKVPSAKASPSISGAEHFVGIAVGDPR